MRDKETDSRDACQVTQLVLACPPPRTVMGLKETVHDKHLASYKTKSLRALGMLPGLLAQSRSEIANWWEGGGRKAPGL